MLTISRVKLCYNQDTGIEGLEGEKEKMKDEQDEKKRELSGRKDTGGFRTRVSWYLQGTSQTLDKD